MNEPKPLTAEELAEQKVLFERYGGWWSGLDTESMLATIDHQASEIDRLRASEGVANAAAHNLQLDLVVSWYCPHHGVVGMLSANRRIAELEATANELAMRANGLQMAVDRYRMALESIAAGNWNFANRSPGRTVSNYARAALDGEEV